MLERYFGLSERGTDVRTEVTAGVTTFLTMAYIAFVNPQILADAGMPFDAVFVATCLAAAFSTLVMGLYANYPIALAPGMGLNAFFAYGVVLGLGHTWEVALGRGVRLRRAVPRPERAAGAALDHRGDPTGAEAGHRGRHRGCFWASSRCATPASSRRARRRWSPPARLMAPEPVLSLLGFCAIVALAARRVPGAALIGMLGVAAAGLFLGVSEWQGVASLPPDPTPTLLALDMAGALQASMVAVILTFLIVDLFDTTGTLIGVAHQAQLLDDRGRLPRMQRALIADSTGTVGGALLGTSPVTSYIESAAGTSAGGRTGLTAVVVAGLFLACLFLAPLAGSIPPYATAAGHPLRRLPDGAGARADVDWRRMSPSRPPRSSPPSPSR